MTKIGGCNKRRSSSSLSQFNTSYSSSLSEMLKVRTVSFDGSCASGSSFFSSQDCLQDANVATAIHRSSMDSVNEHSLKSSKGSSLCRLIRSKSRGQSTNLSSLMFSDENISTTSQSDVRNLPLSSYPLTTGAASESHGEYDEDNVWGQFVDVVVPECDDYSTHSLRRHLTQNESRVAHSISLYSSMISPYKLLAPSSRRSRSSGILNKNRKNVLQDTRNYPICKVNGVVKNDESNSIINLRRELLGMRM